MRSIPLLATLALCSALLTACGGTKTVTVTSTVTPSTDAAAQTTATAAQTTTTAAKPTVPTTCKVTGVANVTPSTVAVQVRAKGYPQSDQEFVGCSTAKVLVDRTANVKAQSPVSTPHFTCTPTVTGSRADFVCVGSKGTIRYAYTLNYT